MTKILLLSDTHSYIDAQILKFVKQADQVWHAGDIGDIKVAESITALKPFIAVYGNIDNQMIRNEYKLDQRFMIEKVSVWMTHIGGYPKRYDTRIKEALFKDPPKLFISGHSHILKVMYDKELNLLHINPGAAGIYGLHKVRTMVRFEINKDKIEHLEVIELAKRF